MHHDINKYQLRLDVQRFLWPVYYIVILGYIIYAGPLSCLLGCNNNIIHRPEEALDIQSESIFVNVMVHLPNE